MTSVEVVCCSAEDCLGAESVGAHRIELCCAIELGGLTPTPGLLRACRRATSLPIVAMVRPRPGDFVYSEAEVGVMMDDLRALREEGAEGFATGLLSLDGALDPRSEEVIGAAGGLPLTMHRAFDQLRGKPNGFARVLTSGGAATALKGATRIRQLVEGEELEVIAAGGIRAENVREVAARTGCKWVHLGPFVDTAGGAYGGCAAKRLDTAAVAKVIERLAQEDVPT